MAEAFDWSAYLLKNAADICERPALCTQAKITLRMNGILSLFMRHQNFFGGLRERRSEPAEECRRRECAGDLNDNKSRSVSWSNSCERICKATRQCYGGISEGC